MTSKFRQLAKTDRVFSHMCEVSARPGKNSNRSRQSVEDPAATPLLPVVKVFCPSHSVL